MRCVGEEAAQAILAFAAIGEGLLDLSEHLVQRGPEATHLRTLVGRADAAGEVAMRDLAGHAPDPLQRPQAHPNHDPPKRDQRQDHAGPHQRFDDSQTLKSLIDLPERNGDDEHAPAAEREPRGAVAQGRPRGRAHREQVNAPGTELRDGKCAGQHRWRRGGLSVGE